MKKNLFLATATFMLVACSQTGGVDETVSGQLLISPVLTRVTDTAFEEGDQIGVTITTSDGTAYATNVPLTYGSSVFSGSLTWYSDSSVSTIAAYYPYDESGVPTSFTVAADQTSGLSASDFIAGTATGVTPSESAVAMNFKHQLSKILVKLDNASASSVSMVKLTGSVLTADVDVAALTASVSSSEAGDITAYKAIEDSLYSAIVVPQTVALGLSVTLASGTELTTELASTTLLQGGQYTVNATVEDESITVYLSSEVEDWTDDGEVGPGSDETEVNLSVSPTSVSVAAAGESFTVTVGYSGDDLEVSIPEEDSWLIMSGSSVADGETVFTFTAATNTNEEERSTTITFSTTSNGTSLVQVTQAEPDDDEESSLSVSPTNVNVAATGESFTLTVACDTDYSVDISDDWLTMSFVNDTSITFSAEANTYESTRTAIITITTSSPSDSVTVTVTQADSYNVSGKINGYEYTDLGLSVKWATYNVGATSPEDYGNYYAWGETETKETYTSDNSVTYGAYLPDISGDADYDAAAANWGSAWRMPTYSELAELINDCTWTETTVNEVSGYVVTGTNGNSIFLPYAGYWNGSSLKGDGSYGYYWSSTPTASTYNAFHLYIYSSKKTREAESRYIGNTIRPVYDGGGTAGTLNGHAYVDLGLSVKWATCNIGADSPEEYGNYYAWGETETKDTYTSDNSVTYGVDMISGNADYDAATANWGSSWRMPTGSEITELRTSCTWAWTTYNGVKGYEVTGTNGNSIFLPAAGYRSSSSLLYAGSAGYYWGSTPDSSDTSSAHGLHFSSGYVSTYGTYGSLGYRYHGYSVRPVSE